ncbi:hypothetical protein NBRC116494_05760 [Aurantivibrio plasticivorans]
MIIEPGDAMLISHRRLFSDDTPRYFVGTVDAYQDGLVRITGTTWLHDLITAQMHHKEDKRTKVIALTSGTFIAYLLPSGINTDNLRVVYEQQHYFLCDEGGFKMDISDRVGHRSQT